VTFIAEQAYLQLEGGGGGVCIKIALSDRLFVCIYEFENRCSDLEFDVEEF